MRKIKSFMMILVAACAISLTACGGGSSKSANSDIDALLDKLEQTESVEEQEKIIEKLDKSADDMTEEQALRYLEIVFTNLGEALDEVSEE